ncbi:MAG TPA: hypothetical protein PKY81_11470 [bacterium]|nr:hypothetical protein [bacterium]HPN31569.1 hypothetical protein [bacterium]
MDSILNIFLFVFFLRILYKKSEPAIKNRFFISVFYSFDLLTGKIKPFLKINQVAFCSIVITFIFILKALVIKTAFDITEIDDKINYLIFLIIKTESSVKRLDIPTDFFKSFHLGIATAAAFFLQINILSLLMIRENIKLSKALYSFFYWIAYPLKNAGEKFNLFRYAIDENQVCITAAFILYCVFLFLFGFEYNFHAAVNIIICGFYNCILIIDIIIWVIAARIILNFIKLNFAPVVYLKKLVFDLSEIFIFPISNSIKIKLGIFDLTPAITALILFIIQYVFSSVILGVFQAYNIGF